MSKFQIIHAMQHENSRIKSLVLFNTNFVVGNRQLSVVNCNLLSPLPNLF